MAVITETAFEAANQWSKQAGADLPTSVILGVIRAALPHLSQADGLDGEYWSTRFDRLDALLATPQAPTYADYPDRWDAAERQREREHREQLAKIAADEAFRRGVTIGRTQREAELLDADVVHQEVDAEETDERAVMRGHRAGYDLGWKEGQKAAVEGELQRLAIPRHDTLHLVAPDGPPPPTDYEVWRDACTLAATQPYVSGVEVNRITLLANAEWWWETLQEVPTQKRDLVDLEPEQPDCPGCGADSTMGHFEDCPVEDQEATDEAETEGERQAQEAFENGFGTYPGHDMTVTTGGCGPEHPCPACRQRIADSEAPR